MMNGEKRGAVSIHKGVEQKHLLSGVGWNIIV
jgi:hypothetical protein